MSLDFYLCKWLGVGVWLWHYRAESNTHYVFHFRVHLWKFRMTASMTHSPFAYPDVYAFYGNRCLVSTERELHPVYFSTHTGLKTMRGVRGGTRYVLHGRKGRRMSRIFGSSTTLFQKKEGTRVI